MTNKKSWLWRYSIMFMITCFIVYFLHLVYGKSFIYAGNSMAGDGLVQHYTALAYYGEWLRTIVRNIFVEHRFSIPTWDLSIGLGGDVISTLNYYVLGDPLNLSAVFVPVCYTEILYNALVLVRLYLAGVMFFLFCRHKGYEDSMILFGALIYVFSFYSIVVSVLHPFFLNPLIYFPLVLLGIDLILEGRRPYVFVAACTLSALSNFYFFYMISVLMVIYAVLRYIAVNGAKWSWRHFFKTVGTCVFFYLCSVMIAMPVFLPSAMAVLGGDRIQAETTVPAFYELLYYVKLVIAFVNASADYYSALGYTSVGVLAVLALFFGTKRKEKRTLKLVLIVGTIFLCVPFFGHVLNGFSYVTNRWVWAYCLAVSVIVVDRMPQLLEKAGWTKWLAMAVTILFAVPTFLFRAGFETKKLSAAGILLFGATLFLVVFLMLCSRKHLKAEYAFAGILLVNLFLNAYGFYSVSSGGDIENHADWGIAYQERTESFYDLLPENSVDAEKVRIDTADLGFEEVKINSAMLKDVNGTSFYYSVVNENTKKFIRDMQLPVGSDNIYVNMDSRTIVDTLLGSRFCVVKAGEERYLPYGYDLLAAEENGYRMYENEGVLPLVYAYESCMAQEEYEKLPAAQRQQALLQTCIVEKPDILGISEVTASSLEFADSISEYQIVNADEGILQEGNRIIVETEGASLTLRTEAVNEVERYVVLRDLWYSGGDTAYLGISDGQVCKNLTVRSEEDRVYSDLHDFVCNMGYRQEHGTDYVIRFEKKGVYTFDRIEIVNQPVEDISPAVAKLTEDSVEYVWEEDAVNLDVKMSRNKILYLAIPYSTGWNVSIDGEEADTFCVNHFGIGIVAGEGAHHIELQYHTPYMEIGVVFMIMGIGMLGIKMLLNIPNNFI